jgi:ferric-dicitrate binding protein FerR (iron transport regulator)
MTNQEDLEERLDRLGRAVAPGPSIAEDVLRRIEGPVALRPAARRSRLIVAAAALFLVGIGAGLLLGAVLARRAKTSKAPAVAMRIVSLEGTVLVKHSGAETWEPLAAPSAVRLGDTLQSLANATVSVSLEDGSTITLEPFTTFHVGRCDGGVELGLEHGLLRARLNGRHRPLVITTPHGKRQALGTEFTVSVN